MALATEPRHAIQVLGLTVTIEIIPIDTVQQIPQDNGKASPEARITTHPAEDGTYRAEPTPLQNEEFTKPEMSKMPRQGRNRPPLPHHLSGIHGTPGIPREIAARRSTPTCNIIIRQKGPSASTYSDSRRFAGMFGNLELPTPQAEGQ
jgi:hypothetical protein